MSIGHTFSNNDDLIEEASQQASGVRHFLVRNEETGETLYGSGIYVQTNDQQIHITVSSLEHGRFPNSPRLYDFLRDNARIAGRPMHSRHRYELQERYVPEMVRILRAA